MERGEKGASHQGASQPGLNWPVLLEETQLADRVLSQIKPAPSSSRRDLQNPMTAASPGRRLVVCRRVMDWR